MRQITCVLIAGWVFGCCCSAGAQQPSTHVIRIGYLASFGSPDAPAAKRQLLVFKEGLKDLGYVDGKTFLIDYRYPKENSEQSPQLAAELIKLKVDILIAVDSSAIRAAKKMTQSIPIVMITNQDPVASGFVQSLARPGENVTGVTRLTRELSGKRLEILKEVLPDASRVAVLWVRPTSLGTGNAFGNYEAAAKALKIQLQSLEVQRPNPDVEGAVRAALKERANALVVVSNAVLSPQTKQIAEFATKNRLPSMCEVTQSVISGCLMSYASDDAESYWRAAAYVDKILKGVKPGDLPIEQPTKFELAINLKTAKQIGLTIPPNVLARADRVIK